MAFTSETKKELENYISGHLPNKEWYESHFYPFIENKSLRDRLIVEFINARKIYKFFEGLQASDELLLAQIKTQVIMYVSIQEAVVNYLLFELFEETNTVKNLLFQERLVKIGINSQRTGT